MMEHAKSSDNPPQVAHAGDGRSGRLSIDLGQGLAAEQTYRHGGEGVIVVDHTYVPPRFEGRGIALRLTRAVVDLAREKGWKIVPQCSYVRVQFKRHRDWHDVLAGPQMN